MAGCKYLLGIWFPATLLFSQSYNWPCQPFDQQHWINGTFCECRSGSSGNIDHFHDGVDIHLSEGGAVYSVIDGSVTSIGTPVQYGINSWVRVGRYAYVHVDPNPALGVGDDVSAFETILGWTNNWNHIHFKDGYPDSEINAIRENGGLDPLIDPYTPTVHDIRYYVDGTGTEFLNNQIHGSVDIISRSTDHTDEGVYGNNNGILKIGYEVLDSLGNTIFGPVYPFFFSSIPSDSYIHYVYAPGSNTSNYRYIVSNDLYSNNALNVSNWATGTYTIRVMTYDHYLNADTVEQVIQVVEPDNVPPEPPTLISILPDGNGFTLKWLPNNEPDLAGYRLFFSYDMDIWHTDHDESILTAGVSQFTASSFSNNMCYFKLTAVDNASLPNESNPSDIYVFRKEQGDHGLLLIDTYNHPGNTPILPFIGNIGTIAANHIMGMSTIHDTLFKMDTTIQLPANHVPLILTGIQNYSWSDELITHIEDSPFWIMGARALDACARSENGIALLDHLGYGLGGSIQLPDQLIGSGVPFMGLIIDELLYDQGIDSLDVFNISNDTDVFGSVIEDPSGMIVGMASDTFPYLFMTVPLEILPEDKRTDYFDRSINYLFDETAASYDTENLYPIPIDLSFYPNPFNTEGFIRINTVPGTYHIYLVSILGNTIWDQKIRSYDVETRSIRVPSFVSSQMASGPYFLLLRERGSLMASEKIIYIK